jgi:hypothetical protein
MGADVRTMPKMADGFRISVNDLRHSFMLEKKYDRYALLNERVLFANVN